VRASRLPTERPHPYQHRVMHHVRNRMLIDSYWKRFSSRAGEESINDFAVESVAPCTAMIKTLDELDEADDYDGMIQGRVAMLNVETNRKEYVYVMLSVTLSLLLNRSYLS
jgi:hypothetical protein